MTSTFNNGHTEFVGVPALLEKHQQQWIEFDRWLTMRDWLSFHSNHYDWWAFPIDKPSSYGFSYTVFADEINQMKKDEGFMRRHRIGAGFLLLSWGWSLDNEPVKNPEVNQTWANWPIRLAKCARSMWLFGQEQQYESCVAYANYLKSIDTSFAYNGRDLFAEIVAPNHD